MGLVDKTFPKRSRTGRARTIESAVGRTMGMFPKHLVLEQKKNRGVVRNYPLITKELLTDEVNLYLLM